MSFFHMPTKFAVQTSSLSKRWRYAWTLVTNLDFDFDKVHIFNDSSDLDSLLNIVDGVLDLCKTSQLKLFRLRASYITVPTSAISKWINEAVRLNVCEVDIKARRIELPLSLFTCNTLTKLWLSDNHLVDFIVPSTVKLPGLKILDINVFTKPSFGILRLIHGCPVLESLSLLIIWYDDEEDYNFNIPTLKRLKLETVKCPWINKVVLNVPNLEYLFVGGNLCSLFVMEDLSSLVEATVSTDFNSSNHPMAVAELLKGISGVKSLSWFTPFLDVLLYSLLPPFPNLKHLDCKDSLCSRWLQLFEILESFSELEHLCIQEVNESCWIEPQWVPSCMVSRLRTIKITKCKGRKCDMQFIEYILGNAEVLRKLTITCEGLLMKQEMRFCAQLLMLPRASRYCKIHFIGKWLNSIPN